MEGIAIAYPEPGAARTRGGLSRRTVLRATAATAGTLAVAAAFAEPDPPADEATFVGCETTDIIS